MTVRLLREETGAALVMALLAVLLLSLLLSQIALLATGEFEIGRITKWDNLSQYLAEAGVEHQVYLLKGNKDAGSTGYATYPADGTAPGLSLKYVTSLTRLASCGKNPVSRRWEMSSWGTIWRINPDTTLTLLQQRMVVARAEITYTGTGVDENRFPATVVLLRWEERVPSPAPPPLGDPTPPTVAISSPADGAAVSGIVPISATASDDVGVTRVEFFVDCTKIGEDTTAPYSLSWDTSTVGDGAYTLTAKASDAANSTYSAGVAVTVTSAAPPTITSFSPASGPKGTKVIITGTNFTGATAVQFGTGSVPAACFAVNSPTQITAYVPEGGTTGKVSVTAAGTGLSATDFTVLSTHLYYVRKTYNDTNTGLCPANAWLTIGKAATTMAAGDTVYVGAGTYVETVTVGASGTIGNVISYIADTAGTQTGDAGAVIVDGGTNTFVFNAKSFITLDGFEIMGAAGVSSDNVILDTGGGDLTFRNTTVHSAGRHGVHFNTGSYSNITFDNSIVRNNGLSTTVGDGIRIRDVAGVTVRNSQIYSNARDGLSFYAGTSSNVTIENSTIRDNGASNSAGDGVPWCGAVTTFTFRNNTVTGNSRHGLNFCAGADSNVTIEGNTVSSNGANNSAGDGMSLCDGISTLTIRNNTVNSNARHGIYSCGGADSNVTIEGNTASSNGRTNSAGDGMPLCDGTTGFLTIRNNTVNSNSNDGINFCGGTKSTVTIEGNTVSNNGVGNVNSDGMPLCDTVTTFTIRSNTVNSNARHGIYFCGGGDSNVTIERNTISNNGLSTAGDGVQISELITTLTARNNLIYRNTRHGIYLSQNNPTGVTIYNNTITNNTGSGLIRPNLGSNVWTVQNNIITNNTGSGIAEENFASDYNDVFNNAAGNYTGGAVAGANDISVDPLFVDVVTNNFRLQAASPAVNTGTDLSAQGVTVDVEGTARPQGPAFDRGAYEQLTPTIISFSPTSGPKGTKVIITGTNFTGATAVQFGTGSVPAACFAVNSSTQITAYAPEIGTTGKISVTTANGTGLSATDFTVLSTRLYYVRKTGSDTNTGLCPANAWLTIGKAAATTAAGDTVYVGAGTYNELGLNPIVSGTAASMISFIADADGFQTGDAGDVIVDGTGGITDVFRLNGDKYIIIDGFEVRNSPCCKGIFVKSGSNFVIVRNNIVHDNGDEGIAIDASTDAQVINNLVYNNRDANEGQILIAGATQSARYILRNNTVYNSLWRGIKIANSPNGTIQDNIVHTSASSGIQIDATSATGLACSYNVVFNGNPNYNGLSACANDINSDPLFVNPAGADFHLSQTAAGQGSNSPAVDSGSQTAAAAGLSTRTTRTDGVDDAGTVDRGFHYR